MSLRKTGFFDLLPAMISIRSMTLTISAIALMAVTGCTDNSAKPNRDTPVNDQSSRYAQRSSLFGPDGISFSTDPADREGQGAGSGGIGVNSFLWRATLDTIVFMPVSSADPFGGVILTDWYTPPGSPGERFKLNVYILDRQLRADGLRVAVFRQIRDPSGEWVDSPVNEQTGTALEDTILTRARELRVISTAAAQ